MKPIITPIESWIGSKNSFYSCFAGNNYLGLATNPELIQAATDALHKYGVNFSASRKTTGTADIHIELEALLAAYKDKKDAVTFATGYLGNHILLHTLRNQYSVVIADSQAHPSILEGIPRQCKNLFYDHCNSNHLESILKKNRKERALVITDGIFSLTGEIAPLHEIAALMEKYDVLVVVDDAHSTGVLGRNGRGTPEHFNLEHITNLYQTETLSKAFGAYGGFLAGDEKTIEQIRSESYFYGASTALPPPIVAAGCASVKYIQKHPELREKLLFNAELVRKGIIELGFDTTMGITPIVPVFFDERSTTKGLSDFLKENLILAPAIDYPVKLKKHLVRITVSANHSKDQIDNLLYLLKKWRDNHGTE